MTFVLLGSRAALARQFASKAGKHECLSVSRHSDADATLDLQHATQDQLLRAAATLRTLASGGSEITVFLFATTYTYDGDIAIAKRAVQLSRLLRARRVIYVSSWVVALEGGGMDFPYRRAKLECEELIHREWEGESSVVRVANVIGSPELLQQRMLDQFGTLLPRSCVRCYIHVDEACAALLEAATAPFEFGSEQALYSAYGTRKSIGELVDAAAGPRPPLPPVLGAFRIVLGLVPSPLRDALLYLPRLFLYMCIALLSHVHIYFKGWYLAGEFAPKTERELRSFFNHQSNKVPKTRHAQKMQSHAARRTPHRRTSFSPPPPPLLLPLRLPRLPTARHARRSHTTTPVPLTLPLTSHGHCPLPLSHPGLSDVTRIPARFRWSSSATAPSAPSLASARVITSSSQRLTSRACQRSSQTAPRGCRRVSPSRWL